MAMHLTKIALLLATTIVLQLMFAVDRTQGQGQGNGNNGNKGNNGNTPNKSYQDLLLEIAQLKTRIKKAEEQIVVLQDDSSLMSKLETIAQAYCAARMSSSEWVFSVFRNCKVAPTCDDLCNDFKDNMLDAIDNRRTTVECFDAIGIHLSKKKDATTDEGALTYHSYSYGTSGCRWMENHCGPRFCCCKAHVIAPFK